MIKSLIPFCHKDIYYDKNDSRDKILRQKALQKNMGRQRSNHFRWSLESQLTPRESLISPFSAGFGARFAKVI